jgi:hypothetical protein
MAGVHREITAVNKLFRLPRSLSWQSVIKLLAFIGFLVAANQFAYWMVDVFDFGNKAAYNGMFRRMIVISAVVYTLLLALPFVPGVEIGMTLLTTIGPPIALLVYLCTLAGLTLSFLAGRFFPLKALIKVAKVVGLRRISSLLRRIEPLDKQERLAFLSQNAPHNLIPVFLNFRHTGLGLLFNLPGNFLMGGGGGIGLIAGVSGLFSFTGYFLTIMIAVSPVPLAVFFLGSAFLD